MGLFGWKTSDPLLPVYNNGAINLIIPTRRGVRLLERLALLAFCLFFVGVFLSTIYYLPDISSKVHSVGKDFLIPADGQSMQIKRPRKPLPIPADLSPTIDPSRRKSVEKELAGKILDPAEDARYTEAPKDTEDDMSGIRGRPLKVPKLIQDPQNEKRRLQIIKMMKHAWDNYVKYAWGSNELRPVSKRPHNPSIFGKAKFGATIVDAADTLHLMGLTDEFNMARDWIAKNLNVSNSDGEVSVFEFNIRYIGGLLSSYALSGDSMFLQKAQAMADAVLPAFDTPTGIPYAIIDLRRKTTKNYGWASGGSSILSEFGTLHLEWAYLTKMTGKAVYLEKVTAIRNLLEKIDKPKGLYPNYLNPTNGKWGQVHVSVGALGDSFYEYLFKAWLWSGKVDQQAKNMFFSAMPVIEKYMLQTSKGGLKYFGDYINNRVEHKMDHLACFIGGLYGLSAEHSPDPAHYMSIAKDITHTCHESYVRTQTKLGPESFRFSDTVEAQGTRVNEKSYLLRPETIESYFIMWRITKDPKYREWGWDAAEALETYCRATYGYTGLKDVYESSPIPDDVQQSYFLAETLKYLFLLFSDDEVISLDEWVLNTEAHPLPIQKPVLGNSSHSLT